MNFPRASGILLHPTSLPGEFGIGDLGPAAYSFVDFLEAAGQRYWQILPLGPTGYGDSPYQSFSAFAGNTLLISPKKLIEGGLITAEQAAAHPQFPDARSDYGSVYKWKTQLLSHAFDTFQNSDDPKLFDAYSTFQDHNGWWLNDYALYRAIGAANDHKPWYEWPDDLKLRRDEAVAAAFSELALQIEHERFKQFIFFRQWGMLKEYADKHGVKIIGDLPIFVALDSADVWCNQDQFKLNDDGSPRVVAGVPPDFFSKTGQLWGNPIYDWDAMRRNGFGWWAARVAFTLRCVDIVRFDHFRGFSAAWEVPGTDETAENGQWVEVPGRELFGSLQHHIGELPVIAEDLGFITPDVEALRDAFGFPGMKVLQFAFGGDARNHDLPHNYVRNCVAYTGTHDNDTTLGWWRSQRGTGAKRKAVLPTPAYEHCLRYLDIDGSEINWEFIRAVWASVADTAIAPLQDVLGIGSKGRMNLPATASGNWSWRFREKDLTPAIAKRLRLLTETFGRSF